jgi:uncharacterized protein (UPF0335 family)
MPLVDDVRTGDAPGMGHNQGPRQFDVPPGLTEDQKQAVSRLRSLVERIERLDAEKQTIADDIRDIYKEAKSSGFETAVLRKLIALRRKDAAEVAEAEALLDSYKHALGM